MCVETMVVNGMECGLDTLHVLGESATRGRGDGFREPASVLWPRMGCDDGNMQDGDVWNAACKLVSYVVDHGSNDFPNIDSVFLTSGTQAKR